MVSGWTDKGIASITGIALRNATPPTTFYLALVTSAVTPTKDTNTFSQLTEVAAGNGYTTGGIGVPRSAVGFDVLTEADPVIIQLADVVWTASGGTLPASGNGARYAVLIDDNATIGSREVYAFFDLVSDRQVSDTQTLTVEDAELQGDLP